MDKSLKSVRTKFTLLSISLAIFCSVLGGVGVYTLTKSRLNNQINANKISELTSGDPAVSEYLETQKQYYKHFETIAAAIQRDNSKQITRNLPIIILGAAIISGAVGWILSRKLLVPVKNSFLSQRRFMQDAAHELRNPLAAMKTMTQQARRKPPKDEPLRKFLSSIDAQLQHLSAITTDLLLLERSEYAGSEPTDIVALLNDILEQQHHLI
ncbi:hypothetical protein EB118_04490, partial [bacterium]|nr:hypothetical protein [bacterium]